MKKTTIFLIYLISSYLINIVICYIFLNNIKKQNIKEDFGIISGLTLYLAFSPLSFPAVIVFYIKDWIKEKRLIG